MIKPDEVPPPPASAKLFLDQQVIPTLIDMAGSIEAVAERIAERTRRKPLLMLCAAATAGGALAILSRRRRRRAFAWLPRL